MSSAASAGTAAAEAGASQPGSGHQNDAAHSGSASTSRSSVSTNSDENRPISSSPVQASRSDSGWRRMRRASSAIGISSHEASSSAPSSHCSGGAKSSAGISRQPT